MSFPNHSIGTYLESSLHNALKFRYTGQDGRTEVKIDGFIVDGIKADGEFIEIQLGGFNPLKEKVKKLAAKGKVRVVHPVFLNKYIEVYDKKGKKLHRRKSPLRGNPWDLFNALCYAPELPLIPGITIELALIDVLEQRTDDGKGSRHRKGTSIADRELLTWHGQIFLEGPTDYLRFIPFARGEQFTSQTLRKKAGISIWVARKTLYTLTKMRIIKRVGKKGNNWLYEIGSPRCKTK